MQREGLSSLAAEIRAHPAFPAATRRFASEFVEWRAGLGVTNRLISNSERQSVIKHLLMLHFANHDGHRETGATFEQLAARCEAFEGVGSRAVRTALRLLEVGGFVVATRSLEDRRRRLFQPTFALFAHARERYAILFAAFDALVPGLRIRARLNEEPDFLVKVLTRVGQTYCSRDFGALPSMDVLPQLLRREGATAVLTLVVDCFWRGGRLPPPGRLADAFQISGSQIRLILKAAVEANLIVLGPRGRLLDASGLAEQGLFHYSLFLAFFARYGFEFGDRLSAVDAEAE